MGDKIKPGRELDALVWVKVMGEPVLTGTKAVLLEQLAPRYSTDKSEAMKVVNKIKDLDEEIQAKFGSLYNGFLFREVKPDGKTAELEINPFQICLAALKAVGHEF